MPAISHLASLGFKPQTSEILSKAFITSITESSSLKKSVSRHKQNIRIYCQKY